MSKIKPTLLILEIIKVLMDSSGYQRRYKSKIYAVAFAFPTL